MTHVLKTDHKWFLLAKHGYKNVEIRNNDRGFKADDIVVLADWEEEDGEWQYTGEIIVKKIDWVYDDVPGLKDGYVLIVFVDRLSDEDIIQTNKEFLMQFFCELKKVSNCKDCIYHEVLAEVFDIHVDEQDCPESDNCEEFERLKEEIEK